MLWRKKERQVIESLRASASAGRLSDLEKQAGCSSLVQFIRVHPVREDTPFHLLLTKKYMFAAIAIILAVALSGGVTYAAEGALPGDALYPIKVRINEEVRAALATSAEADADWDARRVERRLEEAAVLAATGELDAETRVHLEERFAVHAERVKARVEKLEQAGKVEQAERVSERLAVSLQVHERILDEIVAAVAGTGKVEIEVKPLVRKIPRSGAQVAVGLGIAAVSAIILTANRYSVSVENCGFPTRDIQQGGRYADPSRGESRG